MNPPFNPIALILLAIAGSCAPASAAPLNLAQTPPGVAREPAPNIIISVDDSASMGSNGIAALQEALRQTFSASRLPDDRVRLAWQSMNRCWGIPSNSAACVNLNGMRSFSGAHRTNFLNWVNGLTYGGSTPSHLMIDQAGKYLSRTDLGIHSPWATAPGIQEAPVLSCRKSFNIFMTDGAWNSGEVNLNAHVDTAGHDKVRIVRGGNADGTSTKLPDGMTYSTASPQTRLYQDAFGHSTLSTLSDVAFYYWSRDLQPGLPNNVRPSPTEPRSNENFGTVQTPASLEAYWNPRNNPATWQHMVNYVVGFLGAATWTGKPEWKGDTFSGLGGLITGTETWPSPFCNAAQNGVGNQYCDGHPAHAVRLNERKAEAWHAALNSRGRFVPAPDSQALVSAFQGILDDVVQQTVNPLVSIASDSSRLGAAGLTYIAKYDSGRWSGDVKADARSAEGESLSNTPSWSAASLLDAPAFNVDTRNVLTHDGVQGVPFQWHTLAFGQKALLQGPDAELAGFMRLHYLRGHRDHETHKGGPLRRRDSRLGDIVNSNIWHVGNPIRMGFEHKGHQEFRSLNAKRTPMLYVGANDGMLHAFHARDGHELMAYVPRAAYEHLRSYTQPAYGHRFFVDGHPFTSDADVSGRSTVSNPQPDQAPDWRTVLVSGLGGGGRGYFVLDVTTPPGSPNPATSFGPGGVWLDRTFPGSSNPTNGVDKDIGHIYATPVTHAVNTGLSEQIVKLNNGRWAVVMGNGVNSTWERPVLLIQYLDGDRALQTIVADANTGQGNGLSAPRLIDADGSGTADIAYAGDLHGNLWKFDLTDSESTNWGVHGWGEGGATCKDSSNCTPLFRARDGSASSLRQPIASAPMWTVHPKGGVQIVFGTGSNFQPNDSATTLMQTLYGVWDPTTYHRTESRPLVMKASGTPITTGRAALVRQTVTGAVVSTASGAPKETPYVNTSRNHVAYNRQDPLAPRGWYLDLAAPRERLLGNPQLHEGRIAVFNTIAPRMGTDGESCDFHQSTESGWTNALDMISGNPSTSPVFAATDASMSMVNASRVQFGSGEHIRLDKFNSDALLIAPTATDNVLKMLGARRTPIRADWRILH